MKHVTDQPGPRYGILDACVGSLIGPVTAVRRADHLPLLKAWAVHLIGGVLVGIVALLLAAWENGYGRTVDLAGSLTEVLEEVLKALREPTTFAICVLVFLFIEFGWWLSALIVMAWSARDEPFRQSHRRALRRLFLLTPHLATIVAVAGGVILLFEHINWLYTLGYDAEAAIFILVLAAACLWSLRVVLSGLHFDPPRPYCRWPACCARCGYQLTGLRRDQDCPECGLAVESTLDPRSRPGVVGPGGFGWWLDLTYRSMRRPTTLGRAMHVLSPDLGYQRCLYFTITAMLMIAIPAMSAVYVAVEATSHYTSYHAIRIVWDEFVFVSLVVGLWMGVLITGAMMAALLIGSGIAGMLEGWRNGRNLMPAAVRAACYLSGFIVFWAVIFWLDLIFFIVVMELNLLEPIARKYNLAEEDIGLVWQGGVILLGIVIYLSLLGKATRAARHANW